MRSRGGHGGDGEEAALSPPSIYDGEDGDGRAPWFQTALSGGLTAEQGGGPRTPEEAKAWAAAESALAAPLARASAAVSRLDERLLGLSAERRAGGLRHLALLEIADLAWAEGHRLRPERLALVDLDRAGRAGEDAALLGRARSSLRRALSPPRVLDGPEAVARALGCRVVDEDAETQAPDPLRDLLPPLATDRAEAWLAALAPLGAHPLTRSGLGFRLWQRGAPDRLLEPATLAGALALAPAGPAAETALAFLPIALGRPPVELRHGGPARDRLAAWFAAVESAAGAGRGRLRALEDWRERVAGATSSMRGRGAPALADLVLARPVLSAPVAAEALGLTAARTRDLLAAFERRGLLQEMTRQDRFRYWQPVL